MIIGKYIIGTLAIAGLMLGWVAIQRLWRQSFPDHVSDQDVLAGRNSCGNCGCMSVCEKKNLVNQEK